MPARDDLEKALGNSYGLWQELSDYVQAKYPAAIGEWNFPGTKYGWSFRLKDKKRAIVYLLPRDQYFEVAFVFGQKASDLIMASGVDERIKTDLQNARIYAEGRGIKIELRDATFLHDIKTLVDVKLNLHF